MIKIYQVKTKNRFPFNLISLFIRLFQKTNYSHYAMSYISETGAEVFFDSTSKGVKRLSKDIFLKHYKIMKIFGVRKDIPRVEFLIFIQQHEGKSYGKIQILGLALRVFHIVKNNPFGKGKKRIICNELVVLFLNWFNYTAIKDTDSLDLNDTNRILLEVLK